MDPELTALYITAASIGFVHTLLGPDHYLPFVAMSRARNWSELRTLSITALCGFGHVLSSVILGLIGVAIGSAVTSLEAIEAIRGDLAAWALIAFGLIYFAWGIRRAARKLPHKHLHRLAHEHDGNDQTRPKANITPWVLFTIFVLGPCEPLIPVLMYPAAKASMSGMIFVAVVFSAVTITTMMAAVFILNRGIKILPVRNLERYAHALAGLVILLCGVAIKLGL